MLLKDEILRQLRPLCQNARAADRAYRLDDRGGYVSEMEESHLRIIFTRGMAAIA